MTTHIPTHFLDANPNRPLRRAMRSDGRVTLMFGPDSAAPAGGYLMRGGIAWPRFSGGAVRGYVVLCGRHEATGVVYIFEEAPFVTIDWIQTGAHEIEADFPPIAPFLAQSWMSYLGSVYYWRRDALRSKHTMEYPREVWASAAVNPKPQLAAIDWKDEDRAAVRIFVADRQERLAYRPDGGVACAVAEFQAGAADFPPALEALASALIGMSKISMEVMA